MTSRQTKEGSRTYVLRQGQGITRQVEILQDLMGLSPIAGEQG